MKRLQYNKYGAPIQKNPGWCDMIGWSLNRIGGLFYRLHRNKSNSNSTWAWSMSYSWNDIQYLMWIKGYRQEYPR